MLKKVNLTLEITRDPSGDWVISERTSRQSGISQDFTKAIIQLAMDMEDLYLSMENETRLSKSLIEQRDFLRQFYRPVTAV